jgi:2-keto-4-pentenoate hydratase
LSYQTRIDIADALREAHRTGVPTPRLSASYPEVDVTDAYRVQELFIARRRGEGGRIKGYQVGLTSKAMQDMAGVGEPDLSTMTHDMFLPESTPVDFTRFIRPLVEMELAFVPGDVILTGSFVQAIRVGAGDEMVGEFDRGFGRVDHSFSRTQHPARTNEQFSRQGPP